MLEFWKDISCKTFVAVVVVYGYVVTFQPGLGTLGVFDILKVALFPDLISAPFLPVPAEPRDLTYLNLFCLHPAPELCLLPKIYACTNFNTASFRLALANHM